MEGIGLMGLMGPMGTDGVSSPHPSYQSYQSYSSYSVCYLNALWMNSAVTSDSKSSFFCAAR